MINKKELSACCGAEKKVIIADEGTSYYACSKCGKEFIPSKECECKEGASDMCKACHLPPEEDIRVGEEVKAQCRECKRKFTTWSSDSNELLEHSHKF